MLLHDVAPAAERADRHAAADDFAERRQVGLDAVQRLRAAERDAKARHHFVEDQHAAVLVAHRAQRFEKSGHGQHAIHVAGDRLDDDAGDLAADVGEQLLHLRDVVVRERERVRRELLRHAGRGRHAEA